MGQVRKHILLPLCHLILRKVLQAIKIGVKCRGWGDCFVFVCLVLLWIFFSVKQRKWGDKGIIRCMSWRSKRLILHSWSPSCQ